MSKSNTLRDMAMMMQAECERLGSPTATLKIGLLSPDFLPEGRSLTVIVHNDNVSFEDKFEDEDDE